MTVGLMLLMSTPAVAETCAAPDGSPALASIDLHTRIDYLTSSMRRSARDTRIWAWSWAGIYSAIAVAQFATLPVKNHADQIDTYYQGTASIVGVLPLMLSPQPVMRDQRFADRGLRNGRGDCAFLSELEWRAARDAKQQAFGKSPLVHIGAFLVNFGIGAGLAMGYHHLLSGVLQIVIGETVAELQIASQPGDMPLVLERYRAGDLRPVKRSKFSDVHWHLAPMGTGAQFVLTY